MVNKIGGYSVGTGDYANKSTEKTTNKNIQSSSEEVIQSTDNTNNPAYKIEISQMASDSLKQNSKDFEDLKAKIEDIKAKIANGTYEVDTGKIVQGMLRYFS